MKLEIRLKSAAKAEIEQARAAGKWPRLTLPDDYEVWLNGESIGHNTHELNIAWERDSIVLCNLTFRPDEIAVEAEAALALQAHVKEPEHV